MEDITIPSAKGNLVHAVWTLLNPNVHSEQIQARTMKGRKGTRIDIRLWKDDNIGNYTGPTKAGFNFTVDHYPKFKKAMLEIFEKLDKHLKETVHE